MEILIISLSCLIISSSLAVAEELEIKAELVDLKCEFYRGQAGTTFKTEAEFRCRLLIP